MLGGVAGIAGIERLFADFKPADDIVGRVAGLPRRVLGRTKQEVSIVVFPGLSLSHEDQDDSNTAIRQAFERGVNYFDVAPAYGRDGECEIKLGIALQQLDRKKVFLACKTKARDREGSRTEFERSLQRLKTDCFDLYQMHHLVTAEEVRRSFGPGGAIETFLEARKEGKAKWLGFSAHSTRAARSPEGVPLRHGDVSDQLRGLLPARFRARGHRDGRKARLGCSGDQAHELQVDLRQKIALGSRFGHIMLLGRAKAPKFTYCPLSAADPTTCTREMSVGA
jgi:hypothetical protein